MQVKKLKDVAADKGVDAVKAAATAAAEKGAKGATHATGFFSEVKAGFMSDVTAVKNVFSKK